MRAGIVVNSSRPALESEMTEIVRAITPAVADIIARRDGARVELHFADGQFRLARKEVTVWRKA